MALNWLSKLDEAPRARKKDNIVDGNTIGHALLGGPK
jgi:hypothetical protein